MEQDLEKDPKEEAKFRELNAKERMLKGICKKRTDLLYERKGGWLPRTGASVRSLQNASPSAWA